ncbi:MAG: hypothetical protein CV087_23190, partial [Candidatus Brocadia sp. WS118]
GPFVNFIPLAAYLIQIVMPVDVSKFAARPAVAKHPFWKIVHGFCYVKYCLRNSKCTIYFARYQCFTK